MGFSQIPERRLQQVSSHGGPRGSLWVFFRASKDSRAGPAFNALQVNTMENN
uniref:Uncharacterized protein n=1 Tax=Suricata suricatta TaxID=37032 RepID=A0A673U078_SURSU